MAKARVLPQEIWLLVAQEFSSRLDFSSLFRWACVSRGMANLALPLLYSIHESSPASNAHILEIETSVCLWRSIISSSLPVGQTLFPYCHWIKTLRLGNLYSLLEDFGREGINENVRRLRAQFFGSPLQRFDISYRLTRGRGRRLDLDAVVVQVGDEIIDCIKTAAREQDKAVCLLSLEGPTLPTENLTTWVTSLSRLTSLRVHAGTVLNDTLARAIRANCPAFNEVACYMCKGDGVDVKLAGFFNNLEPNTLESFIVNSRNDLGEESFKALAGHSKSLKKLGLFNLERDAFGSLNHLTSCLELETLSLEADTTAMSLRWDGPLAAVYAEIVQWLQQCVHLRSLDFQGVPRGTEMLSEALKSPGIHLKTLNVKSDDFSPDLYDSLRSQNGLTQLAVRIVDEDVLEEGEERREQLVEAICQCPDLRELETNELLTINQFTQITTALPTLEEIDLNGDLIDDSFLLPLMNLSKLKAFTVFGPSSFTFDGILEFLNNLDSNSSSGDHEGFQLYLGDQIFEYKFTADEEKMLQAEMRQRFGGKLDITYRADPDELHESDFTD
ncbi:hypothetical protein V8F06_000728 [Rhypophila decipiens]